MIFKEKRFILKNGSECVLKPNGPEYAEDMIEYLKITSKETPFLLRYPEEVTFTIEAEKTLLERMREDERSVMMVALVDGVVAGNCSISEVSNKRKVSHRCSMGIALKKEYWGLGIGTALLEYIIELAKQLGYEIMELDVVDGNQSAKHLYEKMGFVETGRRFHAMKYDDGTYRDEIIMSKELK